MTDKPEMMGLRPGTILVATDFDKPSAKAVQYAVELAKKFGVGLHVLHVIREMLFYSPAFGGYMPSREQYAAGAAAMLDGLISEEDSEDLDVVTEYRFGVPDVEIVKRASSLQNPLIVIGTQGRNAAAKVVFGSVAEKVVQYAPCPVLTVHADQHEFVSD